MKKFVRLISILLIVSGIGVLLYFVFADVWNSYRQSKIIVQYEKTMDELSEEEYKELWNQAITYNNALSGGYPYVDVFDGSETTEEDAYNEALNVNDDGVIGYIAIPKIDINLAIYHGISDEVLEVGVGHISQTDLITGNDGESTVLAAHRGLPSARLFTDLDQMEEGDTFTISILNKTFTYEVDLVLSMVDKDDYETMWNTFDPGTDESYVSLLTCTPYGVNTHRLIVRGVLIDVSEKEENEKVSTAPLISSNDSTVRFVVFMLLIILAYVLLRLSIEKFSRRRKREDS